MCFQLGWFHVPLEKPWLPVGVRLAPEDGADLESTGKSIRQPQLFTRKTLHFRFECYASTALPDERLGSLDLAAACARNRGTEHCADHPGPGNRFGARAPSFAERDPH